MYKLCIVKYYLTKRQQHRKNVKYSNDHNKTKKLKNIIFFLIFELITFSITI